VCDASLCVTRLSLRSQRAREERAESEQSSFSESERRERHVTHKVFALRERGGGLGSRPKKMYGERLGDGVEYHLMKPTPRR